VSQIMRASEANGYAQLQARLRKLQQKADELRERVEARKQAMMRDAKDAERMREMCAAAEADPRHVAAIGDIVAALVRVAGGGAALMGAAERVSQGAGHLRSEHRAEYGAVREAAVTSPARQAKPGLYRRR
jgi:TolA-binding protein